MPEFVVDASTEVDVDSTISKPMNRLFYKKKPGFPCGHNIREVNTHIHTRTRTHTHTYTHTRTHALTHKYSLDTF